MEPGTSPGIKSSALAGSKAVVEASRVGIAGVEGACAGIAIEMAVVAMIDHSNRARDVSRVVERDKRVRSPSHAPVTPAPAKVRKCADTDADAKGKANAKTHPDRPDNR